MFQEYVSRHHLAASDTERIREWAKENHIGYFTISRKRMLLYDNYYTLPVRFLYKGIIINHNKKPSQPTLKRRFFQEKGGVFSWPGFGKEWC